MSWRKRLLLARGMDFIIPDWPAPDNIKALSTSRDGGVSLAGYSSLNLAMHVGDCESSVVKNRTALIQQCQLPAEPVWLDQVHGTKVVDLERLSGSALVQADAAITRSENLLCTVMTADCLPILLCKMDGTAVAAIHAGWRGLLAGVIENTVLSLTEPEKILAWLGPAIGPSRFEVGGEVRNAFVDKKPIMQQAFQQLDRTHYLADLYALARITLLSCGVKRMYGGEHCTYNQADQFYSYRREPETGRMASLIWRQS